MTGLPLAGRVAAVTGASSGIGRATAIALSRAGATVALAARRRDRLDTLTDSLEGPWSVHEADLANEDEARAFVTEAHAAHGRLHILVNNAGVMYVGDVKDADTAKWRRMLDVNLWALLVCTHAALPLIEQSGGGDIVNVSSTCGRRADAGIAVYNMTKFGVHAFSEALRQEALTVGIRVVTVAPGFVDTEIMDHNPDRVAQRDYEEARARIGEVLRPADVGDAIVHVVTRPPHICMNEVVIRPTRQV